jgi:hypothetical protein
MKGKGVEEKVEFTTLQNGGVTRKNPFFLLEQSAFRLCGLSV